LSDVIQTINDIGLHIQSSQSWMSTSSAASCRSQPTRQPATNEKHRGGCA
jgi:hypothetical protein